MSPVRCQECGAAFDVGSDACAARFDALLALDHSHREPWGSRHGQAFAAYALQHPSLHSASLDHAWHALHCIYVLGEPPARVFAALVAQHGARLPEWRGPQRPPRPVGAPAVTIAGLANFAAATYPERLDAWCRAALAAWGARVPLAAQRIVAVDERAPRSPRQQSSCMRPRSSAQTPHSCMKESLVTSNQLATLAELDQLFSAHGIEYWLFGGWAVDFHVGRVTRAHGDIDVAVWRENLADVVTLLRDGGWSHRPDVNEDGYTGYERLGIRLEIANLVRDERGVVYTPLQDGRADWPADTFREEIAHLAGVRARVVGYASLLAEKSIIRGDQAAAAKDRTDVANLRLRS